LFFERVMEMPAKVDKGKCNGCESCVDECPSEAISMIDEKAAVDAGTCVDCGVCVDTCPAEAIIME
jgi:ferredoxin